MYEGAYVGFHHFCWLKQRDTRANNGAGLDFYLHLPIPFLLPLIFLASVYRQQQKKSICVLITVTSQTKYGITVKEQSAAENRNSLVEKPRMRQMMFLLAFPGSRGGRVAPGWQTVFTRRLEVEEK